MIVVTALVDMLLTKNAGLDHLEPRTRASATPTSFRRWCAEVFRPVLRARGSVPVESSSRSRS
jgi:hypothetical protein